MSNCWKSHVADQIVHSNFRKVLSLGASKPWQDVMEIMTGQRKMDARPLMEYFKPLIKWLQKENKNERPGWSEGCPHTRAAPVQTKTDCSTPTNIAVTFSGNKGDDSSATQNAISLTLLTLFVSISFLLF